MARELILKCVSGARRFVDEISLAEREIERRTVQIARESALSQLRTTVKPFKTFAAIEAWKSQYGIMRWRYKFLVLEGPSRMGKTQFARSLIEPAASEVLELNCNSGEEPDMRGFVWSKHKLVLYDEAHPHMVTRQRLLLQAGAQRPQPQLKWRYHTTAGLSSGWGFRARGHVGVCAPHERFGLGSRSWGSGRGFTAWAAGAS